MNKELQPTAYLRDRGISIVNGRPPTEKPQVVFDLQFTEPGHLLNYSLDLMEADFDYLVFSLVGANCPEGPAHPSGRRLPLRFIKPFEFIEPLGTVVKSNEIALEVTKPWRKAKYEVHVPAQDGFSITYYYDLKELGPLDWSLKLSREDFAMTGRLPTNANCWYFKRQPMNEAGKPDSA